MQVYTVTLYVALERRRNGQRVTAEWVKQAQEAWTKVWEAGGERAVEVDPDSHLGPFDQVEAEIRDGTLYRVLKADLGQLVKERLHAIQAIVAETFTSYSDELRNTVDLLADCMLERRIVRVVGAGRALLAASLPANRLAHGGALVFVLGDRTPFPNSKLGGLVLAASASGTTDSVIQVLKQANEANERLKLESGKCLTVVGIANSGAATFKSLCTPGCFIGIAPKPHVEGLTLRALGDIEEYAISEILDAIVVAAGLKLGVVFRSGHEDLGPTGPWY